MDIFAVERGKTLSPVKEEPTQEDISKMNIQPPQGEAA